VFDAFHEYKESQDAKLEAYKKKFKEILEVDNNKLLLNTLYTSEKETYEKMGVVMFTVSRMTAELKSLMDITSNNINLSKDQLAGNLEKINKW
jgi:hypothetical protein